MIPHVGAAGAGVVVDAQDGAHLVILKAGGEDVRRAVAERIGDEDDRALVDLTDVVALRGIGQRKALREAGARGDGHLQRLVPLLQPRFRRGHLQRERRRREMEWLGRDGMRAQGLQQALAEIDVAAAVAADVEDQAGRRQRAEDAHELLHGHVDQRSESIRSSSGANVASRM